MTDETKSYHETAEATYHITRGSQGSTVTRRSKGKAIAGEACITGIQVRSPKEGQEFGYLAIRQKFHGDKEADIVFVDGFELSQILRTAIAQGWKMPEDLHG